MKVDPANVLDATLNTTVHPVMSRGIVLIDGTAIAAAAIDSITDDAVIFRRGDGKPITVPIAQIARIIFRSTTAEQIAKAPPGTSGLVLANGDFYEGQLRKFDGHSLQIESVLFGIASFDTGDKANALILRDAKPVQGNLIVRTIDGSIFSGERFEVDGANLKMTAGTLGSIAINGKDLLEIKSNGSAMQLLADLPHGKVEGGDEKDVFAVNATTVGLPPRVAGEDFQRVIGLSSGASVTYALDGRYKLFFCRAGVPMNALPIGRARFVVEVDGKPAFQSADRTSFDEAVNAGVKVNGAKSLTLRVEAKTSSLGAAGIWGDPVLIKSDKQP